jgi:predicted phosphoribosyltransferase
MTDFTDIDDAANQVAALVSDLKVDVIFAVFPNGVPIAAKIASTKPIEIRPIHFNREIGEVTIETNGLQKSTRIWVTDDGVETGAAATAVGKLLKSEGFTEVDLVVPVCARDAKAHLQFLYREVRAVSQPLMTRALKWHYEELPDVSEYAAKQMLQG